MSNIWIINQYATTPQIGMGGRHHYLARELAAKGHDVSLIAASNHHLIGNTAANDAAPQQEQVDGYTFVRIPVGKYARAHSKKRILNWFSFAWKISRLHKRLKDKPDVILYSSLSLVGYLGAERLARRLGVKLVFEVRDIWPQTLIEVGGYSPTHPFVRFLRWVEKRAYRNADQVVSNLPAAVEHMVASGMDRQKFTWIPNGFSKSEIEDADALPPEIQEKLPKDKFLVGYVGTIGVANALDTLIDAANDLRGEKDIALVIVGKGSEQARLQDKVAELGLDNVVFTGQIAKRQVQSMLSLLDVCYIGLTADPLFRFGVSPNKLFDYLVSGKPVLYGIDSGDYRPVEDASAGLQIPPEDPDALVAAIRTLTAMSDEGRAEMGENGRRLALTRHEYGTLAVELERVLLS